MSARTTRKTLRKRDGDFCKICFKEMTFTKKLNERRIMGKLAENYATVDHIIPRALGGSNTLDNLRLTCAKCNNERGCGIFYNRKLRDLLIDVIGRKQLRELLKEQQDSKCYFCHELMNFDLLYDEFGKQLCHADYAIFSYASSGKEITYDMPVLMHYACGDKAYRTNALEELKKNESEIFQTIAA